MKVRLIEDILGATVFAISFVLLVAFLTGENYFTYMLAGLAGYMIGRARGAGEPPAVAVSPQAQRPRSATNGPSTAFAYGRRDDAFKRLGPVAGNGTFGTRPPLNRD